MTHENTPNKLASLLKIMQALRAPNGCPWDIEQTPESLSPYILEEACELIDAIEDGDTNIILDELGDLLLQVVFQAQIYDERGLFNFNDIAGSIGDKLVRRHPHVFENQEDSAREKDLDQQWDRIKRSELTNKKNCFADHLPSKLPALQKAQKLVSRAKRDNRQEELPAMLQSLLKYQAAGTPGCKSQQLNEEVLGQTLFEIVKLAQEANLDAETALRKTTRKIINELDRE